MDDIFTGFIGLILFALIYMWGDLAGVDKVTLYIIGALFVILCVVLAYVIAKSFDKKSKLGRGLIWVLSCCISLMVIILIMLIWILIVKYA